MEERPVAADIQAGEEGYHAHRQAAHRREGRLHHHGVRQHGSARFWRESLE